MNNIRIINAENGGFIVYTDFRPNYMDHPIAALTNAGDLLKWMGKELNVQAGADVVAENQAPPIEPKYKVGDRVKVDYPAVSDHGKTVTVIKSERGWVSYSTGKFEASLPEECFEKDETNPDAIAAKQPEWIDWDGSGEGLPGGGVLQVQMKFRDGTITTDFPRGYSWIWDGIPHHSNDVVAYRFPS